jgi:branched-chain amino acid aminotransferase
LIHRQIFHNETLLPVEKARLSVGQSGLICGWGLFTTLRIESGEAFAYERHWRRLEKHAVTIRLPMPYASAKVRMHLTDLIHANKITAGCARIYLVNNHVGAWTSEEKLPPMDILMCTADLPQYSPSARLALREQGRHAAAPLSGVKSISWLNNVWAVAEAAREGFDEVVLLNERNEVAECTSANLFIVKNSKVLTPPLNSGCLEGVTRGILMEIAPEAGVPISEHTLRVEDLYSADEVFIASTNRNVIGVGEVAGHKIANPRGPVTGKLNGLLESYISEYVNRRRSATVG